MPGEGKETDGVTPVAGGTPEGGSPGEGGTPSAPEGQKWWEGRGFKNEEEALSSFDESRRSVSEMTEKQSQSDRVIAGLMQQNGRAAPAVPATEAQGPVPGYRKYIQGVDFSESYQDPKKYAEVVLGAAEKMVREMSQSAVENHTNLMKIKSDFYAANQDLVPYEDIVKSISNEVYASNPQLSLKDGMQLIATQTRAKLASIRSSGAPGTGGTPSEALPHVGAGGSDGAKPTGDGTPAKTVAPALNEVEQAIADRIAYQEKKSGRT